MVGLVGWVALHARHVILNMFKGWLGTGLDLTMVLGQLEVGIRVFLQFDKPICVSPFRTETQIIVITIHITESEKSYRRCSKLTGAFYMSMPGQDY